jgi:hypothetical protein
MFNKKQLIAMILQNLLKITLAAAISILIIFFTGKQISKIGESLAEKRTLAFILEKRSETMVKLREDFKKVEAGQKKIKNAIPPVNNILGFVDALESLGKKHPIEQSLKFNVPVPAGDELYRIDYNLSLKANISTLIDYLKSFEKMPYFTGINTISLSAGASGWENDSSVSMQAKLYVK